MFASPISAVESFGLAMTKRIAISVRLAAWPSRTIGSSRRARATSAA